jgi:hypothetical protein
MDLKGIVSELKRERDRLDRAIAALDSTETVVHSNGASRPRTAVRRSGGSRLSAAGRKRLSDLMKKRWAERKKKSAASK